VFAAELALVARSRGVGTHLLSRKALESLADTADLSAFTRGLARLGSNFEPIGDAPDLEAIERAAGRTAAAHMRTLLRWQKRRPGVLDVFIADQERRSLRALLRGALQGAPASARIAGLLPTPGLPVAVLAELAKQASPSAVVAHLVVLRHPDSGRLLPLVAKAQPEIFPIEVALLRGLAARAIAAAKPGDSTLREFVRERIDLGNVQNAMLLAGGPKDVDPGDAFVGGGRWLSEEQFATAAAATSRHACLARVTSALAGSPLAGMLPVVADDITSMERTFLANLMQRLAREARMQPLGSAPLLRVLLRIEAQSRDVRALAWGATLGTPPSMRKQCLVTPWQ